MQATLDSYNVGHPDHAGAAAEGRSAGKVIDAFRDVQAARADQERLQNEASAYANRIVPEARGEAERILQAAEGYKQQTVAEATGQAARFLQVYEEYKKAPDVTRQRMFLETMERVLGGTDKIILDDGKGGQGVVPYLPLDQLQAAGRAQHQREATDHAYVLSQFVIVLLGLPPPRVYCSAFIVHQTEQALVLRFGEPKRVIEQAGPATGRCRSSRRSTIFDKRILDLDTSAAGSHRLGPEASRRRCLRALPDHRSAAVLSDRARRAARARGSAPIVEFAIRRVLGAATFQDVVRDKREALMRRSPTR